jgi:hypothetical protein
MSDAQNHKNRMYECILFGYKNMFFDASSQSPLEGSLRRWVRAFGGVGVNAAEGVFAVVPKDADEALRAGF